MTSHASGDIQLDLTIKEFQSGGASVGDVLPEEYQQYEALKDFCYSQFRKDPARYEVHFHKEDGFCGKILPRGTNADSWIKRLQLIAKASTELTLFVHFISKTASNTASPRTPPSSFHRLQSSQQPVPNEFKEEDRNNNSLRKRSRMDDDGDTHPTLDPGLSRSSNSPSHMTLAATQNRTVAAPAQSRTSELALRPVHTLDLTSSDARVPVHPANSLSGPEPARQSTIKLTKVVKLHVPSKFLCISQHQGRRLSKIVVLKVSSNRLREINRPPKKQGTTSQLKPIREDSIFPRPNSALPRKDLAVSQTSKPRPTHPHPVPLMIYFSATTRGATQNMREFNLTECATTSNRAFESLLERHIHREIEQAKHIAHFRDANRYALFIGPSLEALEGNDDNLWERLEAPESARGFKNLGDFERGFGNPKSLCVLVCIAVTHKETDEDYEDVRDAEDDFAMGTLYEESGWDTDSASEYYASDSESASEEEGEDEDSDEDDDDARSSTPDIQAELQALTYRRPSPSSLEKGSSYTASKGPVNFIVDESEDDPNEEDGSVQQRRFPSSSKRQSYPSKRQPHPSKRQLNFFEEDSEVDDPEEDIVVSPKKKFRGI